MKDKMIHIRGCRTRNLKSVDLDLPLGKITLITGPSGSGKTALAVDTLFSLSYLRYIESVSPMIRQRFEFLQKPDFDSIENLPPALLFQSFPPEKGKRETVATAAGLLPLLSICFARLAGLHCPGCGRLVRAYSINEMIETINGRDKHMVRISFDHSGDVEILRQRGLDTHLVAGKKKMFPEDGGCDSLRIWIDDLETGAEERERLYEDIETVRELGGKYVVVGEENNEFFFPFQLYCIHCRREFDPPADDLFDFHTSNGACPACRGTGFRTGSRESAGNRKGKESPGGRCLDCSGSGFHPRVRAFRILDLTIQAVLALSVEEMAAFIALWSGLRSRSGSFLQEVIEDLRIRLNYLKESGVGSIPLDRAFPFISRGERVRISLTSILNSGLNDSLMILDCPAEGFFGRDLQAITSSLLQLKANGNTVLLIDGSGALSGIADYFVEMGPGSGPEGGFICFSGDRKNVEPQSEVSKDSINGVGRKVDIREKNFSLKIDWENPEKQIETLTFPIGDLTLIAGGSGSGKSRLIRAIEQNWQKREQDIVPILIDMESESIEIHETIAGYLGVEAEIRAGFAALKESRQLRMHSAHFSRSSPAGRCPECGGKGFFSIDMQFLPPLREICPHCRGSGLSGEALKISWKGRNIAQVFRSSIGFFLKEYPPTDTGVAARMRVLVSLDMGYLELGRRLEELSMGEQRRLFLVRRMIPAPPSPLFLIDDPFLGLHQTEIEALLRWIDLLLNAGASIVIAGNHPLAQYRAERIIRMDKHSGE